MNPIYVFDACALIAVLSKESGWEHVEAILKKAKNKQARIVMHALTLYEVYYNICMMYNESLALQFLEKIEKSPIELNTEITKEMIIKAGKLKGHYKMSLADSIGLAQTILSNGSFVTADHHELDIVDEHENINFTWIR